MPPAPQELASAPASLPASRTSLREAQTSSRQQPATEPQPSVCPPASPAVRAEPGRGAGGQRGHQGRDGAAKQPRPGPRRFGILNTHAHTRAGQSIRPEESEGASTALHSFPKGEVPFTRAPPSRHPRGLQEGQLRHASSPPAHTPRHPRAPARLPASPPHRGRYLPGSPQLRRPAAPVPRRRRRRQAVPLRPAALRSPRPAGQGRHRREAPATPSAAASGATAGSREGAGGGGPRGRRRGRGAKVQAAPGPAAPPSPPTPAPAVSPPGTGSHRRQCLPLPSLLHLKRPWDWSGRSGGGSQRESGRERRMPAYLPGAAPGNFPEVRGGAKHLAGGIPTPHSPTRAHMAKAPVYLSVRPPPEASRAGRREGAPIPTPGVVLLGSRPVRAPRRAPPAGLRLPAAPPPLLVPCPRAPAAFSRAREGACEPRRRRRAALPAGSPARGAPRGGRDRR